MQSQNVSSDRNDVQIGYDRTRSVHSVFAQQAHSVPGKTAIVCGDKAISYSELDKVSSLIARSLVEAGVTKGDFVALLVPRSLEVIVAKLAILKVGAAYVPIDPAFPAEQIQHIVDECKPSYLFVREGLENKLRKIDGLHCEIRDIDAAIDAFWDAPPLPAPIVDVDGGDVAYVMYTSGSTGKPKGVVVAHRGVARAVLDQNYVTFLPDDVVLQSTTISFDVATTEIWGALMNGSTLVVLPDANFSVSRICDVMRENSVTVASMTTGLFNLFADYASGDLLSLRHVLFAGEVGSAVHARRFMKLFPHCQLTNAYGPTEATVYATAFEIPRSFDGNDLPIGKAIAHTGIHIVDDELQFVPDGVEGQLVISGDGVALGYLHRPDLTAEKFVSLEINGVMTPCYLTGDIAMIGDDGNVVFKGRNDRQVKINGKRIELDAIERALQRNEKLSDGVVVCHQDGATKRIIAYLRPLEPNIRDRDSFAKNVLADLGSMLPPFMIPSAAMVMDTFPMNRAGKIQRAKLPLPITQAAEEGAAPSGATETLLASIWADILNITSVPRDRNCFDLGATSLHIMRVHAALEKALSKDIDVILLFQNPTIRGLAQNLDAGDTAVSQRLSAAAERAARRRQRSVSV